MQTYIERDIIIIWSNRVQGGSLPHWRQKGGGANGDVFISGFSLVCDIFDCAAYLQKWD